MIQVSENQITDLSGALRENYLRDLGKHCRTKFPANTRELSDFQLRDVVQSALERCADHQFVGRSGQKLFLELSISFGSGFDTDPLHGWAAEGLDILHTIIEKRRVRFLYEKLDEFISGTFNRYTRHPATSLKAMRSVMMKADYGLPEEHRDEATIAYLTGAFPERSKFATSGGFSAVMAEAQAFALENDLTGLNDVPFVAILMTVFGHHCFIDPALPWLRSAFDEGGLFLVRQTAIEKMQPPPRGVS